MMEHLNMQSMDKVAANVAKIRELFPNCVTERINNEGKLEHAIDFDMLKQELSDHVVDGLQERYQFTWPDKRKAILAANAPINKTLRPCREESVDFDNTENLYIEGDNLEVLKLLQETYLGKVKMIYIDPPYNTGNDFVYEDDFKQSADEYIDNSGQLDDEGNRLVANTESNGRFHTDWLNMIYPRLKLAKDLLSDDGVIFISIDDNEVENLRKICDEIFAEYNYRNALLVRRRIKSLNSQFASNGLWSLNVGFEYILIYAKSDLFLMTALRYKKENSSKKGRWDVFWSNADRPTMRYDILGFTPETGQWRNSKEKAYIAISNYQTYVEEYSDKMTIEEYAEKYGITEFVRRIPNGTGKNGGVQHWVAPSDTALRTNNWTDIEVSQIGKEIQLPFDNPKSKQLIAELIRLCGCKNDIILDFFSGSATTAHAVMQLNAEDGGKRKFIMVQLPEVCAENSEAYKAGYKNICEIGKERIRRAGKKIKEENPLTTQDLDIGFRVLKCDSSNMEDVYFTPKEYMDKQQSLFVDNIKKDRSDEDLLFDAMLKLDTPLSSKIEKISIAGKTVYNVAQGHLIACFDKNVTDEVITAIAKEMPSYFVMRDSSQADDSVAINFEQIFNTYSPQTVRRVL
ncbi:site-specific DNA-methyltransferase [Phascolarctobacterium succinatutens]|uniref:site-specific DNA-methyltransferase n=1 Tax=Phascolarctobacterium succinatutens TaxID=626940 RepID=UPI00307FE8AF